MKKVFIDENDQNYFDEYGYIIYKGILRDEIRFISELYDQYLKNKDKSSLYESTGANNKEVNNYINESIKKNIASFVAAKFKNYNFYGGGFLVKSPKRSTELPLHQDWSFVDEKNEAACFFWMPLQKVNKENGTIFLIEKSHSFFDLYRSGAYPSNRISRLFIPDKYIKDVELDAGDLLIYSPELFHGSYKNKTGEERIAATALITSETADFQYVHKKDDSTAEIFDISLDSYLNDINYLSSGKIPPKAILNQSFNYTGKKINASDINIKLMGRNISIVEVFKNILKDL